MTANRIFTPAQYETLVRPVPPVTAEELLEFQVATLCDKKLMLRKDADPFRNRIPKNGKLFIFVPPWPKVFDPNELMARVELDSRTGVSYLDAQYLEDIISVPPGAHLLVDVEDGDARRNTKPCVSRKDIEKDSRIAYTTFQGIIHAILFPCVLSHHYLDLVGSQYQSTFVPFLFLDDARPSLYFNLHEGYASPRWGAPSCGSVIGA